MLARCTKAQAGLSGRVAAVLGGQWGDEGKGKLADVLAKNCKSWVRVHHTDVAGDVAEWVLHGLWLFLFVGVPCSPLWSNSPG